jgi:hypothetical protein
MRGRLMQEALADTVHQCPTFVAPGVHIPLNEVRSVRVRTGDEYDRVQDLVGHQDMTMTQRYSHLSPAALT